MKHLQKVQLNFLKPRVNPGVVCRPRLNYLFNIFTLKHHSVLCQVSFSLREMRGGRASFALTLVKHCPLVVNMNSSNNLSLCLCDHRRKASTSPTSSLVHRAQTQTSMSSSSTWTLPAPRLWTRSSTACVQRSAATCTSCHATKRRTQVIWPV